MPQFLKNVSNKTLYFGDLQLVWPRDRIYDIDKFDVDRLSKAVGAFKEMIDRGWLVGVDEQGNLMSSEINVTEEIKTKKQKKIEGVIAIKEYVHKKRIGDAFDPNELRTLGEKDILRGKIKLRDFLELHNGKAMQMLKSEQWTIDDVEDLKMISRHDHRKTIHSYSYQIAFRLERRHKKQMGEQT